MDTSICRKESKHLFVKSSNFNALNPSDKCMFHVLQQLVTPRVLFRISYDSQF